MRRAGDFCRHSSAARPLDLLAIKLHQAVHFMLGQRPRHAPIRCGMRLSPGRRPMPGFGYVLGCFASRSRRPGAYEAAERKGRDACALIPSDIWAPTPSPMSTRCAEATRRPALAGEPSRRSSRLQQSPLHLAWHRRLPARSRPRDEALALYDGAVRASESEDYRDIANAVSLLWRLERHGVAIGGRWRAPCRQGGDAARRSSLVFASIHHLLALVGAGRDAAAETMLRSLRLQARRRPGTQSLVLEAIGIALAEAILAAKHLQHARVVDLLYPIRHRVPLIGRQQRSARHHCPAADRRGDRRRTAKRGARSCSRSGPGRVRDALGGGPHAMVADGARSGGNRHAL